MLKVPSLNEGTVSRDSFKPVFHQTSPGPNRDGKQYRILLYRPIRICSRLFGVFTKSQDSLIYSSLRIRSCTGKSVGHSPVVTSGKFILPSVFIRGEFFGHQAVKQILKGMPHPLHEKSCTNIYRRWITFTT
jgi:hypothetical protein